MNYIVFPFGKYKGYLIKDLPSTYIVLALEQFELPDELVDDLRFNLLSRMGVYRNIRTILKERGLKKTIEYLDESIYRYDNPVPF